MEILGLPGAASSPAHAAGGTPATTSEDETLTQSAAGRQSPAREMTRELADAFGSIVAGLIRPAAGATAAPAGALAATAVANGTPGSDVPEAATPGVAGTKAPGITPGPAAPGSGADSGPDPLAEVAALLMVFGTAPVALAGGDPDGGAPAGAPVADPAQAPAPATGSAPEAAIGPAIGLGDGVAVGSMANPVGGPANDAVDGNAPRLPNPPAAIAARLVAAVRAAGPEAASALHAAVPDALRARLPEPVRTALEQLPAETRPVISPSAAIGATTEEATAPLPAGKVSVRAPDAAAPARPSIVASFPAVTAPAEVPVPAAPAPLSSPAGPRSRAAAAEAVPPAESALTAPAGAPVPSHRTDAPRPSAPQPTARDGGPPAQVRPALEAPQSRRVVATEPLQTGPTTHAPGVDAYPSLSLTGPAPAAVTTGTAAGPVPADSSGTSVETAARRIIDQAVPAVVASPEHGRVEVRLEPPALGRLEIAIDITDTHLRVVVQADRAATLDLLRRHGDILTQQLQANGFANVDVSFSGERGRPTPGGSGTPPQPAPADPEPEPPRPPAAALRAVPASGLDLRL